MRLFRNHRTFYPEMNRPREYGKSVSKKIILCLRRLIPPFIQRNWLPWAIILWLMKYGYGHRSSWVSGKILKETSTFHSDANERCLKHFSILHSESLPALHVYQICTLLFIWCRRAWQITRFLYNFLDQNKLLADCDRSENSAWEGNLKTRILTSTTLFRLS